MQGGSEIPVVIETGRDPVASILWLHGLGADGHDFEPIVPELHLPDSLPLRFVFPHAPYRAVTVNAGYEMRAWYDIAIDARGFHQNESHIRDIDRYLCGLIEKERLRATGNNRIVLAGFSQGAAMALHTGLRYPEPLAGIMALSMPIPLPDRIAAERRPENMLTPVFLAHGTSDPIVPYSMGEAAYRLLTSLGQPVEWHSYDMEHNIIPQEIADIRAWLLRLLADRVH